MDIQLPMEQEDKTTMAWIEEVLKDVVRFSILETQILNRCMFWSRKNNLEGFRVERTLKTGRD